MVLALLAGLVAAVWVVWAVGFDAVWGAVAQAGFGGLTLLCVYSAVVFITLALAWSTMLPPERRIPMRYFYLGRLVRDSIAEISPFSPVGGMVAAARLMILKGMNGAYASASVAADATTEAMAQVVFLAFGVVMAVLHLGSVAGSGPLLQAMIATLLLAIPGIAGLIFLQKRGSGFAERMALRFFPQAKDGVSFRDAIHHLYDSPKLLAASAFWHLVAWVGAGGATWIAFRLVGAEVSFLDAMAIEALLCTLRSIAVFVPAAIGVQEGGYVALAQLFGLPAEMGLAVSLLKRAREIVLGIPALLYWQSVEGRAALRSAQS
ncbi:MAG TPA: lysylphosphatidylglycerol synthase domain-containing protein [Rhizomicrobium sp.]|nr:lysylphosphatidylglycerol synthase domain-containing protein [Rhizomicrobium sp.]